MHIYVYGLCSIISSVGEYPFFFVFEPYTALYYKLQVH